MKKWMVVVALLVTSQVTAKSMSIEDGVNPFDGDFEYMADYRNVNPVIKEAKASKKSWKWSDSYSWFWQDKSVENDRLLQEVKAEINSQNRLANGKVQYLNDASYSMLMGMLIDARETMDLKSTQFKSLLTDIKKFLSDNKKYGYVISQKQNKIKTIAAKYDL